MGTGPRRVLRALSDRIAARREARRRRDDPVFARLREAMLELCFRRGYAEIDLAMLLEAAAVGDEDFRARFTDLEDCFCAVYLPIREDFLSRLEQALREEGGWRERLRTTAYFLLTWLREDPRRTHVGMIDVNIAGPRSQRLVGEAVGRVFDLIDEGRAERPDPDSLTRATAEAVGGSIFNQLRAAIEHGTLDRGEEVVPRMMYAAVLPYLGPAAAAEELRTPPPK